MKSARGIAFMIGMIMLVAGLIIVTVVLSAAGWNLETLSTQRVVSNTYDIAESFTDIRLDERMADVRIAPSSDGTCRVACLEYESMPHTVAVEDGTLVVSVQDERKWMEHISLFSVKYPGITVYLPQKEYGALNVAVTTGDVEISREFTFAEIAVTCTTGDVNCRASSKSSLQIAVSTGDITLNAVCAGNISLKGTTGKMDLQEIACDGNVQMNVTTGDSRINNMTCGSFVSEGNTGKLTVVNTIAGGGFSVSRTVGDVELEACDAAEITVKTSTGSIRGTLLSEKLFAAKTSTGKVQLPQSASGGVCSLTTTTGDIQITLQ